MSRFNEGDRIAGYVGIQRLVFGTVKNPKTPYGMVEVVWDEAVEDTHVSPYGVYLLSDEEERAEDIEEAKRLLAKHGLTFDTAEDNG